MGGGWCYGCYGLLRLIICIRNNLMMLPVNELRKYVTDVTLNLRVTIQTPTQLHIYGDPEIIRNT